MNTRISALLALLGCAAFTGCGNGPTEGTPHPPPASPTITGSVLTEAAEGVLIGTHLDLLDAPFSVDGALVTITSRSTTEIRFPMPTPKPCDVDGRAVSVRAGTVTHTGHLLAARTARLRVGETRVIPRDSLASICVQFPAGTERYVVTALNPLLLPSATPDNLLSVRTWTESAGAASTTRSTIAPASTPRTDLPPIARPRFAAAAMTYSGTPVPFDPRYATATVGDTLTWLDWWGTRYPDCAAARDQLPTIGIVVAAVSQSGRVVIAFDTRSAHAAAWRNPAVAARLLRMADLIDRWAVPAVREVIDPSYQPLRGAGGRWFHVFRSDVHGWSIDNNDAPQSTCRYASEVPSTVAPDSPPDADSQVEYLAGLAIHEYGHHAETVYRVRRWGSTTPPMRMASGWPGIGEASAQLVQETAARLASNQPTGARYGPLDASGSGIPYADFYLNAYGEAATQSLWGPTGTARPGYYDQGTRFLLFLRERWGDATIGSSAERFFARAQALAQYDVPSLAGLVGLTTTEALDRWSVADATDNLVDSAAAAAEALPQLQSWAPQDTQPLPSLMLGRTAPATRTLTAGRGNYAAVYLYAEGSDAGRGVSLTFEAVGTVPVIVRVTRLR